MIIESMHVIGAAIFMIAAILLLSKRKDENKISDYSRKELLEEIDKRTGIITIYVRENEKINVGGTMIEGKAVILVNQD